MEAFLAKDPTLKDTAQRAFINYFKAIFHMKDREVFNIHEVDTDSFAHSLGLAIPPRIRFLQRMNARKEKISKVAQNISTNTNKKYFSVNSDEDTKDGNNDFTNKQNTKIENSPSTAFQTSDNESDDDILTVKRRDHDIELPEESDRVDFDSARKKKPITKAALAKKVLKKRIIPNKKIVFNEEGEVLPSAKEKKSELALHYENEDEAGIDIEKAKMVLKEEDKFDKQLFKERVKAKHKETKRKLKEKLKKRKEDEEVKDQFGESESENEPDLSWLPDPDKLYGEKSEKELISLEKSVKNSEEDSSQMTEKVKKK